MDVNYKSYVREKDLVITKFPDPDVPGTKPADCMDVLKGSECERLTFDGLDVPAAKEDSFDFVRGLAYKVKNCIVRGSVTIKGAIDGWTMESNVHHSFIEVGQFDNYWFPGRPPTRNGIINLCSSPSGPITVRLWDAERPMIVNTLAKVTKVPWFIWFPYFLSRYIQVRKQGLATA